MGEELFSMPKLVFVTKENIRHVVTIDSKVIKIAGSNKNRNSDDLSGYNE